MSTFMCAEIETHKHTRTHTHTHTYRPCDSMYLNLLRCSMRHCGACFMSIRFCASCRQQQWSQKNLSSQLSISMALYGYTHTHTHKQACRYPPTSSNPTRLQLYTHVHAHTRTQTHTRARAILKAACAATQTKPHTHTHTHRHTNASTHPRRSCVSCVWLWPHLKFLRQLVRLVFCSISKLRSMNTSSLLVTVSQCRHRVSLTSVPCVHTHTHTQTRQLRRGTWDTCRV